MRPHPLTDEVVRLRHAGRSYKEIESQTGVNRSTPHYIFRREKVTLTTAQKERLAARKLEGSAHMQKFVTDETRRRGGENIRDKQPKVLAESLRRAWLVLPKVCRHNPKTGQWERLPQRRKR